MYKNWASKLHRSDSSGIEGGEEKKLGEVVIEREIFLTVSEPKTTFVAADDAWARQSQSGIPGTAVVFYFNPTVIVLHLSLLPPAPTL